MEWETIAPDNRTGVLHTLAPFPVAVITTQTNAITANQVEYFTFRPLRLGVAIAYERFTYDLIKSEGEFVINVPTANQIDAVRHCGSTSGRDGNKFIAGNIPTMPAQVVKSICLTDFAAHIECKITREVDFEERTWFIGDVVAARKQPGHIDTQALLCGRYEYRLPGETVANRQ